MAITDLIICNAKMKPLAIFGIGSYTLHPQVDKVHNDGGHFAVVGQIGIACVDLFGECAFPSEVNKFISGFFVFRHDGLNRE